MTRTDRIQWASARVDRIQMHVALESAGGRPLPTLRVEIRYSWKGKRFTKEIRSVLN